jgi:hypothetical protein
LDVLKDKRLLVSEEPRLINLRVFVETLRLRSYDQYWRWEVEGGLQAAPMLDEWCFRHHYKGRYLHNSVFSRNKRLSVSEGLRVVERQQSAHLDFGLHMKIAAKWGPLDVEKMQD